jgi:hypothetical protein
MTNYMMKLLDQKLNKEHYKGLVTYCGKYQYTRYYDGDFKKVLSDIRYSPLSQTVPEWVQRTRIPSKKA